MRNTIENVRGTICISDVPVDYIVSFTRNGSAVLDDCEIEGNFLDAKNIAVKKSGEWVSIESLILDHAYDHAPKEISDFEEHSVWNKQQLGVI